MANVKFNNIRKWAKENGYTVNDTYFGIRVVVEPKVLYFDVQYKESTIYTSIRGKKGRPAGIYVETHKDGKHWKLQKQSQKQAIEDMEFNINF